MLSLIIGFATRYLPDLFSWLGGWFTKKSDAKAEAETIKLQIALEEAKAKAATDGKTIDAESAQALANIQGSLDEVRQLVEDRKSAREMATKWISMMDVTLSRGKELGVYSWILSLAFVGVIAVEILGAAVVPMIAATVFSAWSYITIKAGNWTPECWELLDAVIGFFLAHRVKKGTQFACAETK